MDGKAESKTCPYLNETMEITLPVNIDADNLPKDIRNFHTNVKYHSTEIQEEYKNGCVTETFLTIRVKTKKNISRKSFRVLVITTDFAGKQTKKEYELFLTPEEESYVFKEAMCQITENYLNIMENSAVCPMACHKK